jgi:hypothetical protein
MRFFPAHMTYNLKNTIMGVNPLLMSLEWFFIMLNINLKRTNDKMSSFV